jgi:hypothetical protein
MTTICSEKIANEYKNFYAKSQDIFLDGVRATTSLIFKPKTLEIKYCICTPVSL